MEKIELNEEFFKEIFKFSPAFEETYPKAYADLSEAFKEISKNCEPDFMEFIQYGFLNFADKSKGYFRLSEIKIITLEKNKRIQGIIILGDSSFGESVAIVPLNLSQHESATKPRLTFFFYSDRRDPSCEHLQMVDASLGWLLDEQFLEDCSESSFGTYMSTMIKKSGFCTPTPEQKTVLDLKRPAPPDGKTLNNSVQTHVLAFT